MIRTATLADVTKMLDWAAQEGWNPGLDDAEAFFAADPGGFFVTERGGQLVACLSVVNHSDSFAFLGLYICHPEWRGQGLGYALWQHGLAHAGGRTVGLDGVAAQQENYARSGFVAVGATHRMAGAVADLPQSAEAVILPLEAAQIPEAEALDQQAFGIARPGFLRAWLRDSATRRSFVQVAEGRLTGLVTARLCQSGCKVGPVIAADAEQAQGLAAHAARALGASEVILDVPDSQPALLAGLQERGFASDFATARMYRGPAPKGDATGQAVATLELG